ncbi:MULTISPECIES: hypothetical protein [Azospirillaceae]|uniref:hypothetical protein n=1 Tax=Azospirillaceae TaxID=2829815 RepID=UPI000B6A17F2|nr:MULTISPECIES: hypothetical protein [Azospirillaceae]MDG5496954.1 hypothetical protein [Niveispirillum sp. BGYR6]SNS83382.1 hypothetical protein SAMN05880556_1137 [Azospirillum sp. RU38E]SNT00522.1 hypothetical protein SAMN05880591_1137 [Azospirillum sp. RU37A]
MSGFRQFKVTEEALKLARIAGMYGNVAERVATMARQSAPFTHPRANRRFQGFVLRIEGDSVIGIWRYNPDIPLDPSITPYEPLRPPRAQEELVHAHDKLSKK